MCSVHFPFPLLPSSCSTGRECPREGACAKLWQVPLFLWPGSLGRWGVPSLPRRSVWGAIFMTATAFRDALPTPHHCQRVFRVVFFPAKAQGRARHGEVTARAGQVISCFRARSICQQQGGAMSSDAFLHPPLMADLIKEGRPGRSSSFSVHPPTVESRKQESSTDIKGQRFSTSRRETRPTLATECVPRMGLGSLQVKAKNPMGTL